MGDHCEAKGGQCPCKSNYAGVYCDKCADTYYKFPECLGELDLLDLLYFVYLLSPFQLLLDLLIDESNKRFF